MSRRGWTASRKEVEPLGACWVRAHVGHRKRLLMDRAVSNGPNAQKSERPMQRAPSADSSGNGSREQEFSRTYAPEAAGTPQPEG